MFAKFIVHINLSTKVYILGLELIVTSFEDLIHYYNFFAIVVYCSNLTPLIIMIKNRI